MLQEMKDVLGVGDIIWTNTSGTLDRYLRGDMSACGLVPHAFYDHPMTD